jgi:hypothetical protein
VPPEEIMRQAAAKKNSGKRRDMFEEFDTVVVGLEPSTALDSHTDEFGEPQVQKSLNVELKRHQMPTKEHMPQYQTVSPKIIPRQAENEKKDISRKNVHEKPNTVVVEFKQLQVQKSHTLEFKQPQVQKSYTVEFKQPQVQKSHTLEFKQPQVQKSSTVEFKQPQVQKSSMVEFKQPQVQKTHTVEFKQPQVQKTHTVEFKQPQVQKPSTDEFMQPQVPNKDNMPQSQTVSESRDIVTCERTINNINEDVEQTLSGIITKPTCIPLQDASYTYVCFDVKTTGPGNVQ